MSPEQAQIEKQVELLYQKSDTVIFAILHKIANLALEDSRKAFEKGGATDGNTPK